MYFIQRGIVDVLTKDGTLATSLGDGSHFGGKLVALEVKCLLTGLFVIYERGEGWGSEEFAVNVSVAFPLNSLRDD